MASSTSEPGRPPPLNAALAGLWLVVLAVGLLALDARATYGARVSADEPQYLLTALSLAEDVDLDISDELSDRRYLPFHEITLDPQTIDLDGRGQRLSPHDPLLPLVLAPAMAIGGWVGAKVMLAAIGATTAAVTAWVAIGRLGVGRGTAIAVVTALFCAPPLSAYATQVYPEMPAALATVAAVGGLLAPHGEHRHRSTAATVTVVVAVIALPWLSVKYVPVAAVLALALLVPMRSDRARAIPAILALAVAGAAYLLLHRRIYGGWTVYAAGDHFTGGEFDVVGTDPNHLGRSRRLLGLLVDRGFGLVPWTPAYALSVPAVVFAVRRSVPGHRLLVAVVATGWAVATWVALTMHGWWWPGRQVVVVLPLVVLAIALLVDGRPLLRAAAVAAAGLGSLSWLWLVWEASTGRRTLIVDFAETASPVYRLLAPAFPDHMTNGLDDQAQTAFWLVAMVVVTVAVWRAVGPDPAPVPDRQPQPDDRPAAPPPTTIAVDRVGRVGSREVGG